MTALDVCSGGNVLPGVGYPMANRASLEAVAAALNGSAIRADGGFG